jgi:outer membrane protein OmpA-like peptidoglycan-associated protein
MSRIIRSEAIINRCLGIATLSLVAACGSGQDRAMTPAAGQPEVQEPQTREPEIERDTDGETAARVNNRGYLGVGDQVRTRCNLPDTPGEAPLFEYDEANLQDRGKSILDGVAQCLKSGALQNESVTITGHADPRGPEAYNQGLGMRRAQAARDYLVNAGVPEGRIRVDSSGEQQAVGSDSESFERDRRVEVEVAPAP